MTPPTISIPDDFVLDVHDLAAIVLDVHAQTEPLFPHAQLLEVNRGASPFTTFPKHFPHPSWHDLPALEPTRNTSCTSSRRTRLLRSARQQTPSPLHKALRHRAGRT
ncbi:hypothetical protein BD413DRAFT_126063 [Trametes elegans]|nr:hypothetical protein BD413DRAFT_126063 [Trametes elegans]